MTPEEWEALCDGCGKCCRVNFRDLACPQLDVETRRCRNYDRRTALEPCVRVYPENVEYLHGVGVLPDSCAYVRHAQGLPPLDPPPKAELTPFEKGTPAEQNEYLAYRRVWFAQVERT